MENHLQAIYDIINNLPDIDKTYLTKTEEKLNQLTKPLGSLGKLEDIVKWLSVWQKTDTPHLTKPYCIVFAGNHGVTAQNISAYPAFVTEKMVQNFLRGGAAINQICKLNNIEFECIPVFQDRYTNDISQQPAMSEKDFVEAFYIGYNAVPQCDILILGEMGIGNTTAATAIATATLGLPAMQLTGKGTGIDETILLHKANIIEQSVHLHKHAMQNPLHILSHLGGFELAALAGAIIASRQKSIPLLLDGFIVTAVACVLYSINSNILDHTMAGHLSDEKAHSILLNYIEKQPILHLNMRLGEASGAALCYTIVKNAIYLYDNMATFADFE
jgi:nicotinate-nucleotide--dimethylbenzimidazole phosphoribosyltransferase